MSTEKFKPYIAADKKPLELTVTAVIVGVLLAVLFGGANAYLGLRVGMTISASIPAAVISMAVIRVLMRRDSILENNMVQTIGSAGESLAAGCIFTLPVLFMWAKEWGTEPPPIMEITVIAFIGGILGILFMVPLRQALIVKEHGVLPYPEGTACADILLAGEGHSSKAGKIFAGLGFAAVYKFIADGLKIFPSEVDWSLDKFKGAGIGCDVLPALLGVGYICGYRVSSLLLSGAVLSWFCLMPCIVMFGGDAVLFPGKAPISELGTWGIWSSYVRYIGAGALAAGGIIGLIKTMPMLVTTFRQSLATIGGSSGAAVRTNKDLPMTVIIGGVILMVLLIGLLPIIPLSVLGAFLVVIFGFFFATVSSRIVGVVGSSNNPVSGMTIAAMLFTTFAFILAGNTGQPGMVAAVTVGSLVAIIAAMAADTSQDLKTGYILGATPFKQQLGEVAGVAAAALSVGGILYLLDAAWGFGSQELAAPQAMLMKMVVEGVMSANLPWGLIGMGVAVAIAMEILQIPVLAVAIGMYLPIHMSLPMWIGGIIRKYFDSRKQAAEDDCVENGTLFASGMIAGEGILGILLALMAVLNVNADMSDVLYLDNAGGVAAFALLIAIFVAYILKGRKA